MNSSRGITALVILSLQLLGCGGSTDTATDELRHPLAAQTSAAPEGTTCRDCIFGPATFTRGAGKPTTEVVTIKGVSGTSYLIDIDDQGSQGADGAVTLDGKMLMAPRAEEEVGARHKTLNVSLTASSQLSIRLSGKPGSMLQVSIRGGAQILNSAGGVVASDGGAIRLEVPYGAITSPTVITITKTTTSVPGGNLGPVVELGPDGLKFANPVTLRMNYDSAILQNSADEILRIATVVDGQWSDLDTTVDTANHTLTADLQHFSPYTFKEVSGLCISSGDANYDLAMAKLSQQIFMSPNPNYKGKGCVDEGYLQDGYSKYYKSMQNHAGMDFLVEMGTQAHAIVDGWLEESRLNKDINNLQSTLIIRSVVGGTEYRIFYLHCDSHILHRDGQNLGSLDGKKDLRIRAGDEVCQTGNVGAGKIVNGVEVGGYHLHVEVKSLSMDLISPLYAVSGSHCPGQSFVNFKGVLAAGCPLAYIQANTVDPVLLLARSGTPAYISLALGNPGIPGDGIFVSQSPVNPGGANGYFKLAQPIYLSKYPSGATISVFSGGGVAPTAHVIQIDTGLPSTDPCYMRFGSSVGIAGQITVNGVRGIYSNVWPAWYPSWVAFANSATQQMAAAKGISCGNVSLEKLRIVDLWPQLNGIVASLDAVALGEGIDNYPR